MAKGPNNDRMPDIAFIGPGRNKIKHKLVAFIIEEEDADGTPRKLRTLLDHETVNVSQGMKFMTGYVQAHMIKEKG